MSETKFELGPKQKEWIKALRSGEYKQGINSLCIHSLYNDKNVRYCCLGVADKCLNLGETNRDRLINTYKEIGLYSEGGRFTEKVMKNSLYYESLMSMNDSGEFSFNEIADFIETNPESVFKESL